MKGGYLMRLTMLGTGNALVTECYNTCFVLNEKDRYLLVDGGGGSALLGQLKHSGIDWKDIKEIFVTHKHIDHLTGIVWMIRMICQHMKQGQYEGRLQSMPMRKLHGYSTIFPICCWVKRRRALLEKDFIW